MSPRRTCAPADAPWRARRAAVPSAAPALFLLACLTGCRSAPEHVAPPVPVPEAFSASGAAPLPEKWWLSFDDPQLALLVEQALSENWSLRSAWDRLAQAEAVARREGADLKPAVDVFAGASRTAVRSELPGGSKESSTFNEFFLGAAAAYEIDLFGRIRAVRDAAELDARASAEDLQAAAITLSAQVARTWYQLVEQRSQLGILAEQLENNQRVEELVTLRFRRGQVGAADVLRQRQLAESVQGEIERAQASASVLEHQLAILLGAPPGTPAAGAENRLAPLPPLPAAGLPAELIQRRPDVRRAYLGVLAADRRLAAAVADRFPRLVLSAEASTSAENVGDLFDTWLASIAADLIGPIADGGRRRAEVDRNRALLSERLNDFAQAVIESFGEVEDALVRERKQLDFIASIERQLDLSNEVVDRIRDSYTKGAVDYLRILDALISNQSLERDLLAARLELIEFRIDLCRALAGGFDLPQPEQAGLDRGRHAAAAARPGGDTHE